MPAAVRSVIKRKSPQRVLRAPFASGPILPAFPEAPLAINVKILVDGSWLDITSWVYGQDRAQIEINRGRSDEAKLVEPSRAGFQLNNRDGQFSPRNPTSWLYGKIGRNTQIRIAIGADIRFSGEISEWPQRWDESGRDVYVPIEASGILRRLGQGATPLKSTCYRGYTSATFTPVAYWPCEEEEGATEIASALGGPPMSLTQAGGAFGAPDFGASSVFKCSAPLPNISGSQWIGAIPVYPVPSPARIQVWFLLSIPAAGTLNNQGVFRLRTTGSIELVDLVYLTTGDFAFRAYDTDGTQVANSTINFNLDGKVMRVSVTLNQNGANVDWSVDVLEVGASSVGGTGATIVGQTISRAVAITMNPGADALDVVVGHISIHDQDRTLFDLSAELNAYVGEKAGERIQRLCEEEGVAFRSVGAVTATAKLGAQLPATLLDLLREAADADGGILYEPRDMFGLAYRIRVSMYNQLPALTLDYAANHLSEIEPVDDDQAIRNDIIAKRIGGSSFRVVEESGPLSVQALPSGVGKYDEEVTLNLELDRQLPDQAGWRLHLGTVDEARYPVLGVNLARAPFGPTLTQYVRALDLGDRLVVENPPAWLPPDDITQLTQGFTETLAQFIHTIDINCSPETPWGQVAVYNGTEIAAIKESRYSSAGSALNADITSGATSLSVATPAGPLWTTAAGDMPFDIRIGGEVMTVTAISGGSSPQTFTVTRSVNGVVKTHSSGAVVDLDKPVVYVI